MINKETYEELYNKGHLSEKGMRHYISMLKGEVIDYKSRIDKALTNETDKEGE